MALKISWLNHTVADAGLVTVYWFTEEAGGAEGAVPGVLGSSRMSRTRVQVTGTPQEVAAWNAAALACLGELAPAIAELERVEERVRRWRRRLVSRRWAEATYGRAEAAFLDRVEPVAAAYRPVREAVERRIAEQEAQRIEAGRRAYREQERRREEARARFEEWEWRQAAADRPLPGGSTPRELAARDETPQAWPAELRETVGDIDAWWQRVHASVRNELAREEAVRKVAAAITETAAALEAAGRPGISAVKDRPYEVRHGWWVHFTWSGLPDATWLSTPPDMPTGHLNAGQWHHNAYHLSRILLMRRPSGAYGLAVVTSERIANGLATRYGWREWEIEPFAQALVPDQLAHHTTHTYEVAVRLRITDHADPAVFVPYAEAVACRATAAFRAAAAGQARPDPEDTA
ncbi:hypothetical protein OOK31_17455 [Streptomyces sp. NBC_00249]|uniref:hypothetical protein n=1 Tax=Streptomyces sp. NBC_00249 TaxID=2975690 RepID=UPI00225C0BF6|nr:hypothetical protein [Streptomyces sp. NBC_00249]MCX5195670.1 hypothetical protein [Streptomyces sp. NBC_00249]